MPKHCACVVSFVLGTAVLVCAVRAGNPVTIMPLGDSITEGYENGITETGGYRAPLYNDLTAAGYPGFQFVGSLTLDPGPLPTSPVDQTHHEGHRGDSIAQIDYGVSYQSWLINANPSIILLHIGTNDFHADSDPVTDASLALSAEQNLENLINHIYYFGNSRTIYLAGIIAKAGSQDTIIDYNTDIRTILIPKYQAQSFKISYVDQYQNFVNSDGSINKSLYADAALIHPNDAGYALMANTWAQALEAPEPTPIALLAIGWFVLLMRRRRPQT